MKRLPSTVTPTSGTNELIFGSASRVRPAIGFGQRSVASSVPEMRNLDEINTLDSLKDRSLVKVEPDSNFIGTPPPDGVPALTTAPSQRTEDRGGNATANVNGDKDTKKSNRTAGEYNRGVAKSKFSSILPNFNDEKNAPCLRVPLSAALAVIGTIMTLTCCCALLLRNRIVACFDRLRGKKNKGTTSKRVSADEEQGFMGPRTFGKPLARSGRKAGGSIGVTNVGIQNSKPPNPRNGSREFDERSADGCCNCSCTRKKRRNKRKRRK